MSMLKFFRVPFALSGTRTTVPDAADASGYVSYIEGYGADYQRAKSDALSKNIERDKMNQVFFDVTNAIGEIQAQGVPDFITSTLNGGTPYSYSIYSVVRYSGHTYISLVAANTATPGTDATKWAIFDTPALSAFDQTLNYVAGTIGRQLYDMPLNPRAFPWLAKFDNAADDTAALNACATAARAGSGAIALPADGTALVSASINFSGLHVIAYGGHDHAHIRATSAQFDVITTTGGTVLEGLFVHGGWDGSTAGLSGDAISIKATSPAYPYDVHLRNVRVLNAKRHGIYWERGGYSSAWNVKVNACGLHGCYLFGNSGSDACTTVQIGGFSVLSDCPNGYGLALNECINVNVTGAISENTKGIKISGGANRAITLYAYYQENTSGGLFVDWAGSSGIGFEMRGCFGGTSTVPYNANFLDQYYSGNSNVTLPAIPFANRIVQVDGGEATSSTTGGVNVTSATLSLPPGTWAIDGYVQTVNSLGGTITQLGAYITTNAADGGLQTATSVLTFGADSQLYNPGAGVAALRANPRRIIQNTGTAPINVYLRTFLNITAGTVAWRGAMQAVKID